MPIIVAGLGEPDENRSNVAPSTKGCVASFIDEGKRVGVIVELHCESDFVARSDEFRKLAEDLARHIGELSPRFIYKEEVPRDVVAKERELLRAEAIAVGQSGRELEEYVESKLAGFYTAACLMEQRFVRNREFSVGEMIARIGVELAVSIKVHRYVRFELGGKEVRQSQAARKSG